MRSANRDQLRILVVGPQHAAANSRGGMATIVGLMRDRRDPRFRVRTIATYVDDTRARRLLVGILGTARATLLVLTGRVDVLHVHLAHRGSVARKAVPLLAARLVGIPAVIHAHSYDFAGWFDGLPTAGRRLVRRALPAPRWITLGEKLAEEYRSRLDLGADQVLAVSNPVVVPPAELLGARDGPLIGVAALGRLGERKGSYDLVRAVAKLDPTVRDAIRVVAAGDGEVEQVRQAAEDLGVADTLSVRAWIEPAERDRILADSEVFVLASYAEGLPMAMLEAMAWGLVPIVSAVGAIAEVVTDGVDAVVVAPGDVAAVARALEDLVADPDRRRRMGAAAQQRAADFGLDLWFEQLVTLWTSLPRRTRPTS